MVAVSILSIGMVFVLRSFLTTSGTLGISESRLNAIQFLEARMNEYEERAVSEYDIAEGDGLEEMRLGDRNMTYSSKVIAPQGEDVKGKFWEVRLMLSWKEGSRDEDEIIATYFKNNTKK